MSYVTYSPNEQVYLKGIGYGTLINCGSRKTISKKVDLPDLTKKESIYFDPDMFNSDDSKDSKKSEKKEEEKVLVE